MDVQVAPAPRLVGGRSSRFAVMRAIIPIGTFFPGRGVTSWLIAWCIGLAVIIPWSLWSIARFRGETWPDVEPPADSPPAEEPLL